MSGYSNRNLFEKIILFVLMLIASPFIIGLFVIFVLVYIVVYPIEILIYKKMIYYHDLKDKYYLFITLNRKVKIYNKISRYGNIEIINNEEVIKYDNFIIHYYNDKNILILDNEIILRNHNDCTNIIVIKKEDLTFEQFKIISKQSNVIVYDQEHA